MDYEGKYFPDEDEEEISEGKRKRKKVIRYCFYAIIIIVYIVAFTVLLTNCEPDLYETITFSDKAQEIYRDAPEDFIVYQIYPQIFMNYDGSVQIDTVAYTPTANELELGIKYNEKLVINKKAPKFIIIDTNENEYEIVSNISESRGRYVYSRVSFGDILLNLDDNKYINPDNTSAADGEGEAYDTLKFSLKIVYADDKEDEELLIFNSQTAIELIEYKK